MSIRDIPVPPFFKEIFLHLPHALLDLISWREMLFEVTILSKRLVRGQSDRTLQTELAKVIEKEIVFSQSQTSGQLHPRDGEKILKIYFCQIMKSQKVFLDLRPKHFSHQDNLLLWHPNNLWAEFDSAFSDGIRAVYRGYYLENESLFSSGVLQCGLIKESWSADQKREVIEVFYKHFGAAKDKPTRFNLEHFKLSFGNIFTTLLKNKIRLDKNFLYLGVMLVTLYVALDEIGGEFDVSAIFKECAHE